MSTSLEKDLHSVYIDGEMPESFVSQYESIVQADSKEKARLEKMQRLHALLQEDSESMTKKITASSPENPSDAFIEESFARLQTKMRYAKNIELATEKKSFVTPFVKYASSFVAAAAVFAVVFIPVHYNSLSKAKETAVAAISIMKQNTIEPIAQKEVVIDGNINKEDLSKVLAKDNTSIAKAETESSSINLEEALPVEQKTIYATNLASNYGASTSFNRNAIGGRSFRKRLTAVDPFIPDFSSSSITIPVPNFSEIGNNIEMMDLPNESGKQQQ